MFRARRVFGGDGFIAEIPGHARVAIIGGGAVGVSALYHLAERWGDCVLLERGELTAGSTWHAAGNCPTFSTSWPVLTIQRYSGELYRRLAEEVGYPINYHVSGTLRFAHGRERMREFAHVRSWARAQGVEQEMVTNEEMRALHPFIETHDLEGGLWDPVDGDIDPAQLTQALAKGARMRGGTILRHTPVTGIDRAGDEWVVKTDRGDIRAEYVVNAAGYYAQRVSDWFRPFGGRRLPMVTMSHQYMLFDEVAEIRDWTARHGRKLPMVRDPDVSYYLRQEKNGLNLGPYEAACQSRWATPDDPMPEDFSFQLYPDDLERLEPYIEDAMARLPLLAEAGLTQTINGPIPYAPDGLPLIGPMPGVRNAFEATAFTFGIAQGGGAGKLLADWVTEGTPEWDAWACDPRRFTGHATDQYATARGMETYGHEYAMHFPRRRWEAGRDAKLSPVHDRLMAEGAQTVTANGWERAGWFARAGDDTSDAANHTWSRTGPAFDRVAEECAAVRDDVGVLDLCGFSRFNLSGEGAAAWLDARVAGALPKPGRIGLAYFPDAQGRIVTEMSVLRHAEDVFTLITAAVAQWHDRDWLRADLADGLLLEDHTDDHATLLVTGPRSRDLLSGLTDADLTRPWLSHQGAAVAGQGAALARVSFAGELGWEVHGANEAMPDIYDAVLDAGARPFGMWALDSLRIEKGYRAWKQDLSTDYTLSEAGLDRFVRLDKPGGFRGRDALAGAEPARRFVDPDRGGRRHRRAADGDALRRMASAWARSRPAPGATASAPPSRWAWSAPTWPRRARRWRWRSTATAAARSCSPRGRSGIRGTSGCGLDGFRASGAARLRPVRVAEPRRARAGPAPGPARSRRWRASEWSCGDDGSSALVDRAGAQAPGPPRALLRASGRRRSMTRFARPHHPPDGTLDAREARSA